MDPHPFVSVQSRGLIALPKEIRTRYGLDRPGAQVEVIAREGEIVLRPHLAVPAEQGWFWEGRWQEREREADEALAPEAEVVQPAEGAEEAAASDEPLDKVFDDIAHLLDDLES